MCGIFHKQIQSAGAPLAMELFRSAIIELVYDQIKKIDVHWLFFTSSNWIQKIQKLIFT